VVHPPGGVVGGDCLTLMVEQTSGAHALLSTPGAAKWYKANGRVSRQDVRFHLGEQACLEYLPQETIFFNDAHVDLQQSIELAADARYLGCEILCFGRTASGENYTQGKIRQKISIRRAGKLLWYEQGQIDGNGSAMHSAVGLAGNSVLATFIASSPALSNVANLAVAGLREAAAAGMPRAHAFGITQMKGLVVARYLGHSSEEARAMMQLAWQHLRPEVAGRAAQTLRIWNT
jgi:urease accessory protein